MEGVRRSGVARDQADLVLEVIDSQNSSKQHGTKNESRKNVIRVFNKIDLFVDCSGFVSRFGVDCCVSAKIGTGIHSLISLLKSKINVRDSVQNIVHINERQRLCIEKSIKNMNDFILLIQKRSGQDDILAEELQLACYALDEVIGTVYNDAILSEIFSKFCVGK